MKTARRLSIALLLLAAASGGRAQLPLGPQFQVNLVPAYSLNPRVAVDIFGRRLKARRP